MASSSTFNVTPAPTNYSSTFGGVPGTTQLPPSLYQQSQSILPSLPQLTSQAGSVVGANLAGQLSPDVINAIKNQGAAWGISSGMPGSGVSANSSLASIGQSSQQLQQSGLNQFNQLLYGLGSQQLSPSLESEIAQTNATLAASPDPSSAESYLQSLLNPIKPPTHQTITMSGPTL